VVVLGLLGLRRWAALAAAGPALYLGIVGIIQTFRMPGLLTETPFLLIPAIAETVALLASRGPRRGMALMRLSQAVLFAVLGYQSLVLPVLAYGFVSWSPSGDWVSVCNAVVVCFLVALLYRTRHRSRSARGD
jgi:hypothetical protein